jgi:hypothetical protein
MQRGDGIHHISVLLLLVGMVPALAQGDSSPDERRYGHMVARGGPLGADEPWNTLPAHHILWSGNVTNWENWYDVGTEVLAGAVDQTWGRYALAARCLITALRLQPGLPAAHYHLGFAYQKLRENAGGDWKWRAWNSFSLSTRGKTETAYEGLAWFHIEHGDSQAAFWTYNRGLEALCSPPPSDTPAVATATKPKPAAAAAPAEAATLSCLCTPQFVYRWYYIYVLILQYMCPHTAIYVSSYCCICVLILRKTGGTRCSRGAFFRSGIRRTLL